MPRATCASKFSNLALPVVCADTRRFIHALPNVDPNQLSNQLSRLELANDGTARSRTPPVDEFPDLNFPQGRGRGAPFDPSRNRFANAVKRPIAPAQQHTMVTGGRFAAAPPRRFGGPPFAARGPPPAPLPRPSPRLKLRPPTLLPTLPTGAALNELYLDARQGAIRLGQARNACLARAADAWRRGDGAAAKRFSREANVLNERMSAEGAEAAGNLVKQRRAQAQEAIQNRGDWSDDPGDRAVKGKECANGLGVIMGIASASSLGPEGNSLSPEERTEVLLDLHMLHANEGTDVLEDFLLAVSLSSPLPDLADRLAARKRQFPRFGLHHCRRRPTHGHSRSRTGCIPVSTGNSRQAVPSAVQLPLERRRRMHLCGSSDAYVGGQSRKKGKDRRMDSTPVEQKPKIPSTMYDGESGMTRVGRVNVKRKEKQSHKVKSEE